MLHVYVLGEQAITGTRAGVQVRSSRALVLVAFLATHTGSPQARQRIAGTVLAGLDGRAGADQSAPGTASPASCRWETTVRWS